MDENKIPEEFDSEKTEAASEGAPNDFDPEEEQDA